MDGNKNFMIHILTYCTYRKENNVSTPQNKGSHEVLPYLRTS